ncbi:DUF6571 family protein [Streptomyces sp. NPDC046203]|uniref:DUF6571 family protein n=1 Tax=Streptomyces sp. NPDC046203 TaxID=3154602 RepID=UPI0033D50002
MDIDTLRNGDFAQLAAAVTAWQTVVTNLESLDKDAREDMKAKADKAKWTGVNAQVSREFITKTAHEFTDAHTEAKTIYDILHDTHGELVSYKQQLDQALERGRAKNLTVARIPGGFTVTMMVHPDRAAAGYDVPDHSTQDAEQLRDDVKVILDRATESDSTAAAVLRAIVDQAQTGFSGAKYGDRDSAVEAMRKADEAAKLIKEKGDTMSPEEFQKLNGLLASYKDDPLFQERFATEVGPKKMLEFWADLSSPDTTNDLTRTQFDSLGDFQKNLGYVLGGATQSDSPAMRKWEDDMLAAAGQRYKTGHMGEIYGYQLMSSLMRTGDYDDQFLARYGDNLVAEEKKMKHPEYFWNNQAMTNFDGKEFGRDPMSGFMMALTNSPDASTAFFGSKDPQDNAEWVLKGRGGHGYFDDSPLDKGPNEGLDATGKALFAAVSGVSDPETKGVFPEHSPEQREVFKNSLGILASTGNDFPSEMRDSMAYAIGNHGDWAHEVMSDPVGHQKEAGELMEVSKQISRNREDYQILTEGMHQTLVTDILTEKDHPEDSLDRAGRSVGFLEEARYQARNDEKDGDLTDASWKKAWKYHVVGGVLNAAGGPWGDTLQRGVDVITSAQLEDEQGRINKAATDDHTKTYQNRSGELRGLADLWYKENTDWAEDPRHEGYSKNHGVYSQIEGAANDGNKKAEGVSGDQ